MQWNFSSVLHDHVSLFLIYGAQMLDSLVTFLVNQSGIALISLVLKRSKSWESFVRIVEVLTKFKEFTLRGFLACILETTFADRDAKKSKRKSVRESQEWKSNEEKESSLSCSDLRLRSCECNFESKSCVFAGGKLLVFFSTYEFASGFGKHKFARIVLYKPLYGSIVDLGFAIAKIVC